LLALTLPESHDNRLSRDVVLFGGGVVKLHFCVLMAVLCGCEKTQPSMEKAEIDMHKALHKARMEEKPALENPEQETAESIKAENALIRAEFELRSAVNENETDPSKKITKPEIAE
jgi:hypothetical protein